MRVIAASLLVAVPALVSAAVTPIRRGIPGHATWYITETGNPGACGDYLHDGDYTVAMNSFQYDNSMCGKMISITAKGKTTQAKIVDLCPNGGGNCNYGDVDMSPGLFSFFASQNDGKIEIEWDFTDGGAPPPPPPPPPAQDASSYVEPPPPSIIPTIEHTPEVHENVAPTLSYSEPAPAFESIPTEQPYTIPTDTPSVESTTTSWTETTTESTTSTDSTSAAAETTTTPSFGEQIAQAVNDGNAWGLGAALIDLGYKLQYPNAEPATTTTTY